MKLEDVCAVFTDGDWIESKDQSNEGIRLVQTGNIGEGVYLEKEARAKYISEDTFSKLKCTEIFPGDILVSRLPEPVGRACIKKKKKERMITAVDCTICRPDEALIIKEYLCYFMRSNVYYNRLLGNITGTTRKRISRKRLGNVELQIPSKDEQKNVVEKLDFLVKVIDSRKKELKLLDDLIKARFVEMFGDPIVNSMCWLEELIGDSCFVTKLAGFEYTQYIHYENSGDVVMVKAQNVKNGKLNRKDLSYISNEVSSSLPRSQLAAGDVVMTYVGANIGDVAVIDNKYKYHLAPNVAKIRPNAEKYNSVYFMYMLMFLNSYIVGNSADTAKAALGMERIRKLKIFTPPIDLQQQFAAFVAQVNKSKAVIQKALDKTQLLFDSLMQEYFGER